MPRSGTTLLRLMLDAHPLLAIPPETQFIPDLARYARGSAAEMANVIQSSERWGDFGITSSELGSALIGENAHGVSDVLRCFYRLYANDHGKERWGDKTPRYGRYLRLIKQVLPEAHFIHIVRDGRDVWLSHIDTNPWHASTIGDHAARWVDYIRTVQRQGATCGPYLEIRFEDLIGDPAAILAKICSFIGLKFDALMLNYFEVAPQRLNEFSDLLTSRGQISKAERIRWHSRLAVPPDRSRVRRWRHELSVAESQLYAGVAAEV